ncbi:uncharacterized protein LOC125658127 isoform X4 [Ostrea edulis]|uniref:uncharacterized protein LOC125658127 isoform X4 n=1 Tax=Ostrea edulis TaxID=37623 RepID=UPI0024AE965D|nr:uncharacterized protein LOC125658127 isoform X4 [Ostrea edulis]
MGGVFSKCTSKHAQRHSDDDDDLDLEDFTPIRTYRSREHVETHSFIEATEYRHRSGKEGVIRIRQSLSSKNTSILHSQHGSQSRTAERFQSTYAEQDISFRFNEEQRKEYRSSESSYDLVIPDYNTIRESRVEHMITPDEPPIDYEPGDTTYSFPVKQSKTIVEVHVQKPSEHMAEKSATENVSYEKHFKVLPGTKCLPRYQYHRFLLDWVVKGLQAIPEFPIKAFKDCTVVVGGDITDKNISFLFGENTESDKVLTDLNKGTLNEAAVLVVYFLNKLENVHHRIDDFDRQFPYDTGSLLIVMQNDGIVDESLKLKLIDALSKSRMNDVNVIAKNRSEIITKMTCIMEQRFQEHLEEMRRNLHDLPLNENVDASLLEVNALIRRLKQAACYPEPLPEEDDKMRGETIRDMLQSFGKKILYHGFDGDVLHIITTDISVKDKIVDFFSKSKFREISYKIHVEDALGVSFLAKEGTALHGAKFVYVNESLQAFRQDQRFATTGSLMMANGSAMVIVTSRHAFTNPADIYVLIDNSVVKFGHELIHLHGDMDCLHDDITIVEIDRDAVLAVENKCEKLLIDKSGSPTPARISSRQLNVDDIVHKRGARTGLTTGVVKHVEVQLLKPFRIPSLVIQISGRDSDSGPFAAEGDSGSLVFQNSLAAEENILDVLAMVQGKLKTDPPIHNPPVVCFPFTTGCQTLLQVTGLQSLQFFNV